MIFPVVAVLGSCCGCMSLVEQLARLEPGCMNLMTFSTFLFVALEGFFVGTRCLTIPNKIPIKGYLKVVIMFFISNVINNRALSYRIPVPLHIIFRSGSLLASMILGILILKRSYTVQKYASVAMVSVGIIICTLASVGQIEDDKSGQDSTAFLEWLIGVAMLIIALVGTAYLGISQEQMYTKYGKHPREATFFVHLLSLPGFVFMWTDILNFISVFNASEPINFGPISIPQLWLYLFFCDIAQYACIRSVYILSAEFSALSVTLVVTLRKFLSLLFSIWYFQNPFTVTHWLGTVLVFGGTMLFSNVHGMIQEALEKKGKKRD